MYTELVQTANYNSQFRVKFRLEPHKNSREKYLHHNDFLYNKFYFYSNIKVVLTLCT